jgi:hypothetical protein
MASIKVLQAAVLLLWLLWLEAVLKAAVLLMVLFGTHCSCCRQVCERNALKTLTALCALNALE